MEKIIKHRNRVNLSFSDQRYAALREAAKMHDMTIMGYAMVCFEFGFQAANMIMDPANRPIFEAQFKKNLDDPKLK